MNYSEELSEIKQYLVYGAVIATIMIFWTAVSQLVAFGVTSANLSPGLASGLASAFSTAGLANVVLYILKKTVESYRE